jgi:hypothetical protein
MNIRVLLLQPQRQRLDSYQEIHMVSLKSVEPSGIPIIIGQTSGLASLQLAEWYESTSE